MSFIWAHGKKIRKRTKIENLTKQSNSQAAYLQMLLKANGILLGGIKTLQGKFTVSPATSEGIEIDPVYEWAGELPVPLELEQLVEQHDNFIKSVLSAMRPATRKITKKSNDESSEHINEDSPAPAEVAAAV